MYNKFQKKIPSIFFFFKITSETAIDGPDSITRCARESSEARPWECATHVRHPFLIYVTLTDTSISKNCTNAKLLKGILFVGIFLRNVWILASISIKSTEKRQFMFHYAYWTFCAWRKFKKNCHVKYFEPFRCYDLAHDLSFFKRGLVKVHFFERKNKKVKT